MTLAGLPITMLSGFGCPDCGGTCGQSVALGATSIEDLKKFFTGKGENGYDKYIKHIKDIGVYHNPGEAPFKVVPKNDTIGKVIAFNSKGNWAKLEDGSWVNMAPGVIEGYYVVELRTAPPKSVTDAVTREAERAADAVADILPLSQLKWVLGIAVVVGLGIVAYKLFPEETKGAFSAGKKKLNAAT